MRVLKNMVGLGGILDRANQPPSKAEISGERRAHADFTSTRHNAMIPPIIRRAFGRYRLPKSHSIFRPAALSTSAFCASNLSAIHRGLRRSERAQFGSRDNRKPTPRHGIEGATKAENANNLTSRALEGASSIRQQHKLRKKLTRKQREELDEDSDKQTRRKRFLDPESRFGKQSLVYQLKHGALKDEVSMDKVKQPVRPNTRWGPFRSESKDHPQEPKRHRRPDTRDRRQIEHQDRRFNSTPSASHNDTGRSQDAGNDDTARLPRTKRRPEMSTIVQYTTAASQFLYGRSVVKAALEQGRRKLYNLYVQAGESRSDNTSITRLAERRNVPVTTIPSESQRIMDKMSLGRPHNGFVLETSPLPQLPVSSLGPVEESPTRLGFQIELGHQTKEELAINGQETFVKRVGSVTPKPFVLLLHEILDPGNLGALLRTASYLGIDAVGITSRSSSGLTPVTLKSAAGAVEEITIFNVPSPVEFLERSKKAGWKSYAAVAPPEKRLVERHSNKFLSLRDVEENKPLSSDPCILILGNEGHGLPKSVKVSADYEVSVPRFVPNSCVDSLNVSVAAGMLCHAFVRSSTIAPTAVNNAGPSTNMNSSFDDESLF